MDADENGENVDASGAGTSYPAEEIKTQLTTTAGATTDRRLSFGSDSSADSQATSVLLASPTIHLRSNSSNPSATYSAALQKNTEDAVMEDVPATNSKRPRSVTPSPTKTRTGASPARKALNARGRGGRGNGRGSGKRGSVHSIRLLSSSPANQITSHFNPQNQTKS
jgi:hypothetical protein